MTTDSYPVLFHEHDPDAVALPEYHDAREALDRLVHALQRADVEMDQREFIAMVADFASTNAYADCCNAVHDSLMLVYPHSVRPTGNGGLRARYRCPLDGNTWTCGWAINAPFVS